MSRSSATACPKTEKHRTRRQSGIVLALVMVIALMLSVTIITFSRRALIDTMIVRNRDAVSQAEALTRGGLRLAEAMLLQDRLAKNLRGFKKPDKRTVTAGNTEDDVWNQVQDFELVDFDGGRLTIRIKDAGGLLNLNAVVPYSGKSGRLEPDAEEFLVELLKKVIDEMPIEPGEKLYDPRELARNLIDYMDADDQRVVSGGHEDDYYLAQDPPGRPANRPLLSVEEIGLVEGFDVQLMEAMRHYVTVYPIVGGVGVNLNTAPAHVLALVYHGVAGSRVLANADLVQRILKLREDGFVVCTTAGAAEEGCVTLNELFDQGSIFPAAELPDDSDSFTVISRAQVGEIERTLVAVIDRSELASPRLLFWRMQ